MFGEVKSDFGFNDLLIKTPKDRNILLVDDYPVAMEQALSAKEEYAVYQVHTGTEAYKLCKKVYQDVAIIDVVLPDMKGIDLVKKIKEKSPTTSSIIIAEYDYLQEAVEAMDAGASDFLRKPIHIDELLFRVEKELKLQEIQAMSTKDPKTGLYNVGFLTTVFEKEIQNMKRNREPLSFIFFDIDNFKKYNDTYGHLEGDYVLQKISTLLLEASRPTDVVSRFGGEEIVILLPQVNFETAYDVAERFRGLIEEQRFHPKDDSEARITVSGGAACYNPPKGGTFDISLNEIIKAADDALYKAKSAGKNRVWEENFL